MNAIKNLRKEILNTKKTLETNKGEFLKFQATITRMNGKFYFSTLRGVRKIFGGYISGKVKDTPENLYMIKKLFLYYLKIDFENDFKRNKGKQFEEITKKFLKS